MGDDREWRLARSGYWPSPRSVVYRLCGPSWTMSHLSKRVWLDEGPILVLRER